MRHVDQAEFFGCGRMHVDRTPFVSGTELSILMRLISVFEVHSVLEIGVNRGATARRILDACPSVKSYTGVEIRHNAFRLSHSYQVREHPSDAEVARFVIRDPRFTLHLSDKGSGDFKGRASYELVFIDGNHAYQWVKHDTALAKRHNPRVIVWHDYGNIGDVTKAVHEEGGAIHVKGTSIAFDLLRGSGDPKLPEVCACTENRSIRLSNGTLWDGTVLRGVRQRAALPCSQEETAWTR